MKILAARADTSDLEDIKFLLKHLEIKSVDDALNVVRKFYPKKEVKSETVFLLEELLEKSL